MNLDLMGVLHFIKIVPARFQPDTQIAKAHCAVDAVPCECNVF